MSDETSSSPAPAPARSWRGFALGAAVAVALIAGVLAWVVFGMGTSSLLPAQYNGFDSH